MPNCFQLRDKLTGEPVSLNCIDEELCKEVLHCEPHSRFFGGNIFNWYDTIGYMMATNGWSIDSEELMNHYRNSDMWEEEFPLIERIINFLKGEYTSKSW